MTRDPTLAALLLCLGVMGASATTTALSRRWARRRELRDLMASIVTARAEGVLYELARERCGPRVLVHPTVPDPTRDKHRAYPEEPHTGETPNR